MSSNLELSEKLNSIKANDFISIKYNKDTECILRNGVIKKIDRTNKLLYILNSEISFSDIVEIKKCCNC